MITKIGVISSFRHNSISSRQVSFKSYNTVCEDINIDNKKINSSINTVTGNIDIENSKIAGNVSSTTGRIYVSSSNVEGDLINETGSIKIVDGTKINGDINNKNGKTVLNRASVSGDILSADGKVLIKDSIIKGRVVSKPENLYLEGKNDVDELLLKGFKKAPEKSEEEIKAELAKMGIFIKGNIGHINNTAGTIQNVFQNGKLVSTQIIPNESSNEFKLPKGNRINTIIFDADKQGVLILEKETEFLGKVINGVIKRV